MKCAIFLVLAVAILATNVASLGVVSDYLVNNTMELKSGETKIYSIRLQNPTENEIGIKIDYDKSIMRAVDDKEVYVLKPKESGFRVNFNVTAPKEPGSYKVGYTVGEVQPNGGGGISIRLKINKNFILKVPGNYNPALDKTSASNDVIDTGKEYVTQTTKDPPTMAQASKLSATANNTFAGIKLEHKADKNKTFADIPLLIITLLIVATYFVIIKPKKKIK